MAVLRGRFHAYTEKLLNKNYTIILFYDSTHIHRRMHRKMSEGGYPKLMTGVPFSWGLGLGSCEGGSHRDVQPVRYDFVV